MGVKRHDDCFYVIPTSTLWDQINVHRNPFLAPKLDGSTRKDVGHWTLRLNHLKSGELKPNYGFSSKWAQYLNAWPSLDGPSHF